MKKTRKKKVSMYEIFIILTLAAYISMCALITSTLTTIEEKHEVQVTEKFEQEDVLSIVLVPKIKTNITVNSNNTAKYVSVDVAVPENNNTAKSELIDTTKSKSEDANVGGNVSSIVLVPKFNITVNSNDTAKYESVDVAKSNITVNWCILDERNTRYFTHLSHSALSLFHCWSWFQSLKKPGDCGFYLRGTLSLKGKNHGMTDWKEQLVNIMGCDVTYDNPPDEHPTYYVDRAVTADHPRWFWRKKDATIFRERFIDSGLVNENHQSHRIRIGFVNRRNNRVILNMNNIINMVHSKHPEAETEMANMEDLTGLQQMKWWYRQDIVVIAHGAALTNAIFLRNNSAVVEIFPPHYYPIYYFGELCNQAGIRNYGYYNNCSDPVADFILHNSTVKERVHNRKLNLEPPIDAIMDLVTKSAIGLSAS
mmetsp:Transcript_3225/g.6688  ORF Transcript_3225/g.6688 Transcript_3225/m.6688 type:complete len:424 (-) Transcript_3225:60-1331(-)